MDKDRVRETVRDSDGQCERGVVHRGPKYW